MILSESKLLFQSEFGYVSIDYDKGVLLDVESRYDFSEKSNLS